jgi:hypothetical protein
MEARREPFDDSDMEPMPTDEARVTHDAPGTDLAERDSLLDDDRAESFRERWEAIQVRFVDEPEGSVQDADQLVSEVIGSLQDSFGRQRERLEGQWQGGGEASTEDLRVALQGYRSFFVRLLGA